MTTKTHRWELAQVIGSDLFGKPGRMTFGMCCAAKIGGVVTMKSYTQYCRHHGLPYMNTITPEANKFWALHMLEPLANSNSGERRWKVMPSSVWAIFTAAIHVSMRTDIEPRTAPEIRAELLELERSLRG